MIRTILASLLLSLILSIPALAQTASSQSFRPLEGNWVIEEITDGSIPDEIVKDEREKVSNGLPDGRIATGKGDIVKAWYAEPTTRYRHGVLGDAIEAGALRVTNNLGATYTYRLPKNEVFEDITPRIADLDGDGKSEVVTILSSQLKGASIAAFHLTGNVLEKVGQSGFIGRPNRWLNIAAIDRITGRRQPDIAIVVTPHLRGNLQFLRFRNGKFRSLASAAGFSNHVIGSRELRLSAVVDVDGNRVPELVLPSLARDELVIVGIQANRFAVLARIKLPAKIDKAIGTREVSGKKQFVVGLEDNKIYSVALQ